MTEENCVSKRKRAHMMWPDDRRILDGGNHPHGILATGADQRIRLIDLADQPGPVSLHLP
jgi:hypothetical protein